MSGVPEPHPWETSGFWVLVYFAVLLVVLVRTTWGKDDGARRRIVGRVVKTVIALAVALHLVIASDAWAGLAGLPRAFGGRHPGEQAGILIAGFSHAAAVLAALVFSILFASGFRRPRPARSGWRVRWEWSLAAGLVAVGALLPVSGRFRSDLPHVAFPPEWIERACLSGRVLAVAAAVVVLRIVVGVVRARGSVDDERRELLRDGLALWGFLLFAGALLFLEWRMISLLQEVMILGRRLPSWQSAFEAWFNGNRLAMLFAFTGLAALCFGGLHLGRRGDQDAAPS